MNNICPTCGQHIPEPASVTCECGHELACSQIRQSYSAGTICPICFGRLWWKGDILMRNIDPVDRSRVKELDMPCAGNRK